MYKRSFGPCGGRYRALLGQVKIMELVMVASKGIIPRAHAMLMPKIASSPVRVFTM